MNPTEKLMSIKTYTLDPSPFICLYFKAFDTDRLVIDLIVPNVNTNKLRTQIWALNKLD